MSDARILLRAFLAIACAATVVGAPSVSRAQGANPPGEVVYAKYCASCHDQVGARIPTREALTRMSPARILRTLDFGLMMSIAYPMRRDEREAVAKFLGTGDDDPTPPSSAFCQTDRPIMSGSPGESWTGWGPSPANTRFQTPEERA